MHKSISVNMKSPILVQISMLSAIAVHVHEKLSWVINSEVKIISFNESNCIP